MARLKAWSERSALRCVEKPSSRRGRIPTFGPVWRIRRGAARTGADAAAGKRAGMLLQAFLGDVLYMRIGHEMHEFDVQLQIPIFSPVMWARHLISSCKVTGDAGLTALAPKVSQCLPKPGLYGIMCRSFTVPDIPSMVEFKYVLGQDPVQTLMGSVSCLDARVLRKHPTRSSTPPTSPARANITWVPGIDIVTESAGTALASARLQIRS
ncbi:hypothetical protein C8F04DRAFT_1313182 [Mycena alexandri]|uniref:Uncharacterized protein n=1 Tax=Mycena alexandri TaxID=1745969 RepID=A0AAD6S7Z7_9AGAR|nr:hypothetical protein C8F04DRAFT_1313182 [Mycena alexandri]